MLIKRLSKIFSESFLLKQGENLWKMNENNYNYPLSHYEKLIVGLFLILSDYAKDLFPPKFDDWEKAYDNEINYICSLPGVTVDETVDQEIRKPFWYGVLGRDYLVKFTKIIRTFEQLDIAPPKKLLELGCGPGWMAEFLALMKYQVIATTISHYDIEMGQKRLMSIAAKGIQANLQYIATPMEKINQCIANVGDYDAVYVFQALHHAYDWRSAIEASYQCLKPGGWLLLFDEPNVLHTFISYRVARLAQTHEIGFRRKDLHSQLNNSGFRKVIVLRNKFGFGIKPHWIAAQK